MPKIQYMDGKTTVFKSQEEMDDFLFDRGFELRGTSIYFEVEDGSVKKVGTIIS